MGAPAITGAPVVHSQDTALPLDEALDKRGAGLMLVCVSYLPPPLLSSPSPITRSQKHDRYVRRCDPSS